MPSLLAAVLALLASAAAVELPKGTVIEKRVTASDASQSYALYLPTSYDGKRLLPCLLIFDPRGRAVQAAEIFRPGAERLGWMVISSWNTRSDDPDAPNEAALRALWAEMAHYPVDPRRVYAAGFSGGGILTLALGLSTDTVAGVVDVGGRQPDGMTVDRATFAHFAAAGRADFNALPMRELDRSLVKSGVPRRLDFFEGRHQWITAEHAERALTWLELVAMKQGRRPADTALAASALATETAAAEALESAGRPTEAHAHWQMIEQTFVGLAGIEAARARRTRLEQDPRFLQVRREEEKAEKWERGFRHRLGEAAALLQSDPLPTPSRLRGTLGIEELVEASHGSGPRAEAAGRVLQSVFSQTSFYMTTAFFAAGEMDRAILALQVANEIQPQAPAAEYNLACAYARTGNRKAALDALERAFAEGYTDRAGLAADPDLKSLRDEPRFKALLSSG
jgi:predicted esterase